MIRVLWGALDSGLPSPDSGSLITVELAAQSIEKAVCSALACNLDVMLHFAIQAGYGTGG